MKKLAIAIRGHERGTFENSDFSDLIYKLSELYDTEIFIHSWEFSEATISWRPLPKIRNPVTIEMIQNYFSRNEKQIKKIYVDAEKDIEYHGRTQGIISKKTKNTNLNLGCAILPWKRMWFGICKIIKEVYESKNEYDIVLNTRMDILNYKMKSNRSSPEINFNKINKLILDFLKEKQNFLFLDKNNSDYIDNIYVGTKLHMYLLCRSFYYNLDQILEEFKLENINASHERLVFLKAQKGNFTNNEISNCNQRTRKRYI